MQDTTSGVTVGTVAALPGLHLELHTGGLGVERAVETPLAAETPPPPRWLHGGELILTRGAALGTETGAWDQFLGHVAAGGAAGVVVGLGPGAAFEHVPDVLIQLGRRHDVPLLSAPPSTSFSRIARAITQQRIDAERSVLEAASSLQVRLLGIVTRGGNIDRLLEQWRTSTGEESAVFDRVGRLVGRSSGFPTPLVETAAAHLRQEPPRLGESTVFDLGRGEGPRPDAGAGARAGGDATLTVEPFAGETTVRGFLVRHASTAPAARLAVPTLLSLLALEFERRWFLDEPTRRRRAAQFARLVENDDAARARAVLKALGVDTQELWGVVVEAESATRAEVLLDDLAVVLGTPLLRLQGRRVEALAVNDPARALEDFGLEGPVGFGTPAIPAHAGQTLRQAHAAMETSRRAGRPVLFTDGAAHDFLLHVADSDYLTAFADAVLGPLDRADHGAALLNTLHLWLSEARSIDTTARRLDVHRHTVRNRIQRATQLLGRDLGGVDAQTEIWLALKARGYRDDGHPAARPEQPAPATSGAG
ncbi:PucR family transcriptional regulator ligand-binding domain-containing protein [Zhihengliuella sp.]|uniref:helix-turn-helix domain-containing protein n=1 Tax=Zhihengliuella sp. TaxID=1954483 RepID=UPI0028124E24|nr:PucR family transcriptional regulator ligand-binding domain-containing protein [Zhihengliuella sp.]